MSNNPSDLEGSDPDVDPDFADIERVLGGLSPREPSPELRDRMFHALANRPPHHGRLFAWLAAGVAACLALVSWRWLDPITPPATPDAGPPHVEGALLPDPSLHPIFSNREIVEQSRSEITYIEGLGAVEKTMLTVMERDVWASEDGTHVFASTQPRQHVVFVPLSFQ